MTQPLSTHHAQHPLLPCSLTQQPAPPRSDAPQATGTRRAIIHIDMDCFFASVAALAHPALARQPLAVCHSNATHGSGEISSANYLARGFGIHAGQMIGSAKQLCPHLVVMPYDFEQLEAISEQARPAV